MRRTISFIIVFTCCLLVSLYTGYRYYAPPLKREPYKIASSDDTMRIAYIGDSWAFLHSRQHNCIIQEMIEEKCPLRVRVYSYGLPGRTSKEIYEALFKNEGLRQLLQQHAYKYCVISAGINDINKKMGINYYRESLDGIISLMLTNQIHPIILEIPDFDVFKIYRWQDTNRKLLRRLSMLINHVPIDCKQLYRNALDDLILEKNYQNKVSIIRYKSWNKDYSEDLKTLYLSDGVHLNDYGYAILDSIIAKDILTNTNLFIN